MLFGHLWSVYLWEREKGGRKRKRNDVTLDHRGSACYTWSHLFIIVRKRCLPKDPIAMLRRQSDIQVTCLFRQEPVARPRRHGRASRQDFTCPDPPAEPRHPVSSHGLCFWGFWKEKCRRSSVSANLRMKEAENTEAAALETERTAWICIWGSQSSGFEHHILSHIYLGLFLDCSLAV